MARLVQIRSYQLKPGATAAFHRAFVERAVPLLRQWGHEVVAFGPSPHQADTYFLARAYADLDELQRRQDAFYASDAWRRGPREAIVALIEQYLDTVLWLSPEAVDDLRRRNGAAAG